MDDNTRLITAVKSNPQERSGVFLTVLLAVPSYGLIELYLLLTYSAWRVGTCLLAAVMVTAALGLVAVKYLRDAGKLWQTRRPADWQLHDIEVDRHDVTVPRQVFDTYRPLLTKQIDQDGGQVKIIWEKQVLWHQRLHKVYLLGLTALWVGLLLFELMASMAMAYAMSVTHTFRYKSGVELVFAEVMLVLFTVTILGLAAAYFRWSYTTIMLTNLRLLIPVYYPWWLPWLKSNAPSLLLKQIEKAQPIDSGFHNQLHFGIVDVDSKIQEDEDFHGMDFIRRHTDLARKIQPLMGTTLERVEP